MRILFCNKYNFPFSGTEVYLFELMEMLKSQGHEVAWFSMADPRGEPTDYDKHLAPVVNFKDPSRALQGRARLALRAMYSREARRRIRGLIEEFQPHVAHVRNIYHHLSPSILWELRAQGVPVLYHLNDFKLLCPTYNMVSKGKVCERCAGGEFRHVITSGCYTGQAGSSVVLAAEAYLHRWLGTYECVDCFLVPSRFVREKLMANGFDGRRIEVLPHFQKLPAVAPAAAKDEAGILYFGRLSEEKGVADLVRAVERTPQIRLQIAGDGPERASLARLAEELHADNVAFSGHLGRTELEQAIASSRFTVLPSRAYETLGKSILESYAQGRAVVASDLGSRRELVKEGETGLLYRAGDVEQLAGAISFLAERPGLAAQMGAAGRSLVQAQHAPETHYVALMRLYEQMQRGARQPARRTKLPATRRPLRVAFIGGRGVVSKYSGIEAYYEEAGKRLAEMGLDVTVYCRRYFTPPMEHHQGMKVVRLPTIRSKHLETLVHTLLSSMHAMFAEYDIVHYHAQGPALFSLVPRLAGKKTVVTVQGLDWQRTKWSRTAARALRLAEWASARLPNATMVVSRTLQDYYRRRYGREAFYVPNGTTIRERRPPSQILRWGLKADSYVLFLGRFSPEKNCHLLVKAYERLQTPMKLVLAGGSSHTDSYARDLRRHQSDRIRFVDWVSGGTLEELLTNAALFVLPSDVEGLSLALLEAMGAGVCVLTSDIPENRELVENAGFTFRAGDVDDLERMLHLLLSDPQVRRAAARDGQERVRQHYLWPRVAREIAGVYAELVEARPAPAPPSSTGSRADWHTSGHAA